LAGSAVATKRVAGTVETRVVMRDFTAVGNRVVGHGTVTSTLRNAAGATTSTASKAVRLTVATASGPGPCQILYLELDELDLTLLGIRVFLRSGTEGEPIKLTLSADSTHGILGKLFCDLAQSTISSPTSAAKATSTTTATGSTLASHGTRTAKLTARATASQLTKRMHNTTIMRAQATMFDPVQTRHTSGASSRHAMSQTNDCQVLHLILGPLHLDLLGLIVDLNKVALDIFAIPGTTLGDAFCQLVGGPPTTTTTATPTTPAITTTTTSTTPATTTTTTTPKP
jgi:hypothetical protein